MSPEEIARLAMEWHRANGANVTEVVERTAQQYRYSAEQTAAALELAAALLAKHQERIADDAARRAAYNLDLTGMPNPEDLMPR